MKIVNNTIQDDAGRTLILRGVNLGGDSKNPFGAPGWGLSPESLKNPETASFEGRPFPLEAAESHFDRLKRGGMTFCRLVITWEALEHAGPGQYDEAYLAYLRKILQIADEKEISVFMDPHQDVWSRWTGGDGAPAWTLERLGMDLSKLDATGAAITRQGYGQFHQTKKYPEGAPFPRMIWPSNYNRYATATMFTLFFGGKVYAPNLQIDGENVQDWLQGHYLAAFRHCYRRLKNCPAIAGWGVMNEPHYGFIGHGNLEHSEYPTIPSGPRVSPWDAIRAAAGHTIDVPIHNTIGQKTTRHETLNTGNQLLFKDGFTCPWKQSGVWTDEGGTPRLLQKDFFARLDGQPVEFIKDFHKPFTIRFIETMKDANEKAFFFIEGVSAAANAKNHPLWDKNDPPNTVNAFHWYDGFALFTKQFRSWFTIDTETSHVILDKKKVQAYFNRSLSKGIEWSRDHMGGMPSLLGEFGLAFDMNNRHAFANGDYTLHEEALDMYYNAVDENLLHSTIWNYSASNTNACGDGWNDEDLSIFSEGKERAVGGWKRPYPMATAGQPLEIKWDRAHRVFRYRFNANGTVTEPTIIYLPAEWFDENAKCTAAPERTPLRLVYQPAEQRLLAYNDGLNGKVEIFVRG